MKTSNLETATFAGGCFWCTEAVFRRLKGVEKVLPGYTGGDIKNPGYREVCTGRTGHAEAIQVTYHPEIISFEELLEVFFATHDPTTLNQQGNDKGTQYRSAVFYHDDIQKEETELFIKELESQLVFEKKIVTEVSPAQPFYEAEVEHKEYYERNQSQMYCQMVISPKVKKLNTYFQDKIQ